MNFIISFPIAFRNIETKRMISTKLKDTTIQTIINQFRENYLNKDDIGYIIEFDIEYNGKDGSPDFRMYCNLDESAILPSNEAERDKECIKHAHTLFLNNEDMPFTIKIGDKTANIVVHEKDMKVLFGETFNVDSEKELEEEVEEVEEMEQEVPKKVMSTTTPIAVVDNAQKQNTSNKTKQTSVNTIKENHTNDNKTPIVNTPAPIAPAPITQEKKPRASARIKEANEKKDADALSKEKSKEAEKQKKELATRLRKEEQAQARAIQKEKMAEIRKANALKIREEKKIATKEKNDALLSFLATLSPEERIKYIEEMEKAQIKDKQIAIAQKEKAKSERLNKKVEREQRRHTETKRKEISADFRTNTGITIYKAYLSINSAIRSYSKKLSTTPNIQNINITDMEYSISKFITCFKNSYTLYIDHITYQWYIDNDVSPTPFMTDAMIEQPLYNNMKTAGILFGQNSSIWFAGKDHEVMTNKFKEVGDIFTSWINLNNINDNEQETEEALDYYDADEE